MKDSELYLLMAEVLGCYEQTQEECRQLLCSEVLNAKQSGLPIKFHLRVVWPGPEFILEVLSEEELSGEGAAFNGEYASINEHIVALCFMAAISASEGK